MRALLAFLACLLLALPMAAQAEPADIDAAARGVVRVVLVEQSGDEMLPVIHGTGFAVSSDMIVTNAHVVREAIGDSGLRIGIVPSDGEDASYAQVVARDTRADLALLKIVGPLRLPPLTLSGTPPRGSGEVTSVGYPMNVDRAQGLTMRDIFRSQPPVKSHGYISGERPSRQFDTILHTAPIARGNSGGPLLDNCGRVLGVNSFGSDSEGADAEFYFAVSDRELLPFLRANGVEPRVNSSECRSMAELADAESQRRAREAELNREQLAAQTQVERDRRARAQMEALVGLQGDREDRLALAMVLLMASLAMGLVAYDRLRHPRSGDARLAERRDRDDPDEPEYLGEEDDDTAGVFAAPPPTDGVARVLLVAAALAAIGAVALYATRPGMDDFDRRVAGALTTGSPSTSGKAGADAGSGHQALLCTLVPERSRITGAPAESVAFDWQASGCVNERTQYGLRAGEWSRVFVPNQEEAVSVNRFDPESRTYVSDRYLLARDAMQKARALRGQYSAPKCGAQNAAAKLGDLQGAVLSGLPAQPNERLVYRCAPGGEEK
ncbi:trypsin-like serine protease [Erythrobacter sp. 3-20A1M]|uniref:S1 family peptidase n=1 Tax=Erythrobacter sp. 3-20A1M TaxID=2653850 RepID=UPI001BFC0A76|nr:serine protease [Erythrobacter sp. 3-20A1M]QWC56045.1 trypsin-like serine protease [Erythrobacter sp. 3-20A1M]